MSRERRLGSSLTGRLHVSSRPCLSELFTDEFVAEKLAAVFVALS